MSNSILIVIVIALLGVICYTVPQAIDKSFANTDNMIMQHKLSLTE